MPEELTLYPFQEQALESVKAAMRAGNKRVILYLPTGAGKTECAMAPLQMAGTKGSKAAFLCDRIPLVKQTSDRLLKYGIFHGVAQGQNTQGRTLPIQVMSIQTLARRNYWDSEMQLVVWDECHTQYQSVQTAGKQSDAYFIGLSASPITRGLGDFWDTVVNGATTNQLLQEINPATGRTYLCPLTMYAAREIDMQGALITSTGEWKAADVQKRTRAIIGSIVPEWEKRTRQHFGAPVPTLVFSRSIDQGEEIARAFIDAGHDFRQSTYRDSQADTVEQVEAFAKGDYTGLISVDKFVKGYDNPEVKCIIDANPRHSSLAPLIQGMGRGQRSCEGKAECVYIDVAGNLQGWWEDIMEIWEYGVSDLDDRWVDRTRREGKERKQVACPQCGYIKESLAATGGICPACGWERTTKPIQNVAGYTERMEAQKAGKEREPKVWEHDEGWTWNQMCALALREKKGDTKAARKSAAGMYRGIYQDWPAWGRAFTPDPNGVQPEVEKRVKSNRIRYAKGKARSGR